MTDDDSIPDEYETADNVRVSVEFPERWGPPQGDPGTPERRAWVLGSIRADNPDDRGAVGALRHAEALRDSGQ